MPTPDALTPVAVETTPAGEALTDLLTAAIGQRAAAWSGVAMTTSAIHRVTGLSTEGLTDEAGKSIDLETVFELRLWELHDCAAEQDDRPWALEARWLNGSGGVIITATKPEAGSSTPYLCRKGCYLEHSNAPGGQPTVSTLEVFSTGNDEFGNTAFIDELMTGA